MKNDCNSYVATFIAVVAIIVGLIIGNQEGYNRLRNAAIEAGVAEWTINKTNGIRQFQFLSPK